MEQDLFPDGAPDKGESPQLMNKFRQNGPSDKVDSALVERRPQGISKVRIKTNFIQTTVQ